MSAEGFKAMLAAEPPNSEQTKDTDWLLAVGEMFTLVVYAQLVLENAEIYAIDPDLVDEIFELIRKPVSDPARYRRVWENHVCAKRDAYEMAP